MRAVRYERNGGPEVLEVVDVPDPHPGPGQVRVRVVASGINPFDGKVMRGAPTQSGARSTFPAGIGSDMAGVVDEVGEGVDASWLGREVLGGAPFQAHAELVVATPDALIDKPARLDWDRAGSLAIVARTASASVRAIAPGPGDTVLVSAAAGGVGVVACQLLLRAGARVIGTASEANHAFLRELGVEPVPYGEGLPAAVRAIAPEGITAALDNHGEASVRAALELGAPPQRVNTIAYYAGPAELGVQAVGAGAAEPGDLAEAAELIASGELVLPIEAVFPLEQVREAYALLLGGHLRGKIVLRVA